MLRREESSSHSAKSQDMKSNSETKSNSTRISDVETQESLETVLYSYEDHSEGSQKQPHQSGGLKRKLSEMSSGGEGGDEDEREEEDKMKRDAMEQLRICFPHKDHKVRMILSIQIL